MSSSTKCGYAQQCPRAGTDHFLDRSRDLDRVPELRGGFVAGVPGLPPSVFGFGGMAAGAEEFAKVLFFILLVMFVVSLIAGVVRRG